MSDNRGSVNAFAIQIMSNSKFYASLHRITFKVQVIVLAVLFKCLDVLFKCWGGGGDGASAS